MPGTRQLGPAAGNDLAGVTLPELLVRAAATAGLDLSAPVEMHIADGVLHAHRDCGLIHGAPETARGPMAQIYECAMWCSCVHVAWRDDSTVRDARGYGGALLLLGPAIGALRHSRGAGRAYILAELWACAVRLSESSPIAIAIAQWCQIRLAEVTEPADVLTAGMLHLAEQVGDPLDVGTTGADLADSWHGYLISIGTYRMSLGVAAESWWAQRGGRDGCDLRWLVVDGDDVGGIVWAIAASTGRAPGGRFAVALDAPLVRALIRLQNRRPLPSWLGGWSCVVDGGPVRSDPTGTAEIVAWLDGVPPTAAPGLAAAILAEHPESRGVPDHPRHASPGRGSGVRTGGRTALTTGSLDESAAAGTDGELGGAHRMRPTARRGAALRAPRSTR